MNRFTFFGLLVISLLVVASCNQVEEDLSTTDYSPELAIPIIKDASISFMELWQDNLPNQSLVVAPDGSLVFRYESDEVKVTTKDILGELSFPIVSGLADTVTVIPFQLPANIEIAEATLSGGLMIFQFRPIESTTEITFTLPQITKNEEVLVIKTNGAIATTLPVDLTGAIFRPKNNELEIKYSAIDKDGNSVLLESAGIISQPTLQFVKGTWGREEFPLTPTIIPIDLYDDRFLNGNIRFAEPTITASLESSFGVPIRSQVDIFNGRTKRGLQLEIDASAIDGVNINYPELEERGQSKSTVLQIDNSNSNIVDVFDEQLTELEYGLTAIANPDDNPFLVSFIEDSSAFKAQVTVEVPVVGRTNNFVATESFEVPFDDIDQIAEGEFKLIIENQLPLGAQIQFYFMGNENFIIDSLFQSSMEIIAPAPIDETGNVTAPTLTTTFIPVSAEQMQNIIEATHLQVKAIFQTSENGTRDVIIRGDQTIDFKMGLKFKLN